MWGETDAWHQPAAETGAEAPQKGGAVGKSVWFTDAVFVVAPIAAVAMEIWGHLPYDQAIAVVTAAMGYAAGRPVK